MSGKMSAISCPSEPSKTHQTLSYSIPFETVALSMSFSSSISSADNIAVVPQPPISLFKSHDQALRNSKAEYRHDRMPPLLS